MRRVPCRFLVLVCLCVILCLSACSQADPLSLPAADELSQRHAHCVDTVHGQIAAWDTGDPEEVRKVYTDDIVHFDSRPAYVGIEDVVDMSKMMFRSSPDWQMAPGDTYVSVDRCAGEWDFWNTMGFEEDAPGTEFDILDARDGKIAYWRLFYDQAFYEAWGADDEIDRASLDAYAATWSAGEVDAVKQLYARNAVLVDSLLGIAAKGRGQVSAYADAILAEASQGAWSVEHVFGEGEMIETADGSEGRNPADGAVFHVDTRGGTGDRCTLRLMVVLQPDDKGLIAHQEVFWDAMSLEACGWVE